MISGKDGIFLREAVDRRHEELFSLHDDRDRMLFELLWRGVADGAFVFKVDDFGECGEGESLAGDGPDDEKRGGCGDGGRPGDYG